MNVFLLYDCGDLVGIYANREAVEPDAEKCRKSSIWALGHDRDAEIVEYKVKN